MNKKSDEQKLVNMKNVGNFTANAVENFEENLVKQKNYLEEVAASEVPYMSDKFH